MRSMVLGMAAMGMLIGCKEPIGSKIPQPNTAAAAGVTAAVAGALTLANPALAGRKPEAPDAKGRRATRVKQTVPEGVFDRAEKPEKESARRPPCAPASAKPAATKASGNRLAIVPKQDSGAKNGVLVLKPCEPKDAKKKRKTVNAP